MPRGAPVLEPTVRREYLEEGLSSARSQLSTISAQHDLEQAAKPRQVADAHLRTQQLHDKWQYVHGEYKYIVHGKYMSLMRTAVSTPDMSADTTPTKRLSCLWGESALRWSWPSHPHTALQVHAHVHVMCSGQFVRTVLCRGESWARPATAAAAVTCFQLAHVARGTLQAALCGRRAQGGAHRAALCGRRPRGGGGVCTRRRRPVK